MFIIICFLYLCFPPGPLTLISICWDYGQSEGLPRTGYFIPGRVGSWVWPSSRIVCVHVCARVRVQVQPSGEGLGGGLGREIHDFNVPYMILM